MSSGTAVFTSDRRVRIRAAPDTWILQIDPVLAKDDGLYECQVNTRNTMSLVFKLNVERKCIFPHFSIHFIQYRLKYLRYLQLGFCWESIRPTFARHQQKSVDAYFCSNAYLLVCPTFRFYQKSLMDVVNGTK